jgi:hypothetical protein
MADTPDLQIGTTPDVIDYAEIAEQLAVGWLRRYAAGGVQKATVSAAIEAAGGINAVAWDLIVETALLAGKGLHLLEEPFLPVIAGIVAPVLSGLFGAEIDEGAFARKLAKGGGNEAARAIVTHFFKAIEGDGGAEIAPGTDGAARVASAAVAASLESSFNALVPSMLSHLFPFDLGHFTEIMELPEDIIRSLGVGRLVRRAIGPLVTVCAATPMEWHVNKKYSPTLLPTGAAVQQILRGQGKADEWKEDLRRQGYSEKRIDALLNQGRKFFSPSDVRTFYSRGEWTGDQAEQHLRDQGYDADTAHDALRLEGLKRFEQLEGQEAAAIISAYASRDIDRSEMLSLLTTAVTPASERALYTELADVRRKANVKRLSLSQVEAMVKTGVLNMRDYRATAEREGYPLDEVTALELQLRWEIDKQHTIDEHRAALDADRAAAKAARDAAAAARRAQIDAERALSRRGSEADLERAAIHGKIPFDRVVEVYRAHYDDDTVAILVDELEGARQTYLDEQAARDAAKQRGARRNVDTGALDQAFVRGHLTAPELRGRLVALGFDAGDADLLVANAVDQKADADALAKKRAAADATAKKREIDLGRFERLVRKGARTMAQYVTLLQSLDVDEAAIPDFVDALQVLIDEDAAARSERQKAAAAPAPKGLTLEQFRRAVVLGVKTLDEFSAYLIANRYTTDAQEVLIAELRADLDDAELARRRRAAPTPGRATPGATLATIRRAAQLGIVSPDAYLDRLRALGYTDDDLDLELELLLTEIADTQEARRRRDADPPAGAPAGLSLAELERAVKAGVSTIEAYRARAVALGKSPEEIEVLAAVVEHEAQTLSAARAAHDNLGLRLAAAGDDLKALDAGVKDGSLTIVDYLAELAARGVDADEAQLVAAYVAFTAGG